MTTTEYASSANEKPVPNYGLVLFVDEVNKDINSKKENKQSITASYSVTLHWMYFAAFILVVIQIQPWTIVTCRPLSHLLYDFLLLDKTKVASKYPEEINNVQKVE